MKIKKLIASLALAVATVAVLAGCQSQTVKLNPTKDTYATNGLVAVVKGTVSKGAKVTYQIGDGTVQKGTNNDGTFVIQVPGQLKKTTVTVKAKKAGQTTTKKVSVRKTKAIATYPEFAMKYNMINQQMKIVADPLPMTQKNGLVDFYNHNGIRIRANVQNQQVVGIAYVFPVKYMKDKTKMKDFAMRLTVLSTAVGADGKQVLKDYQKLAKDAQSGQTTVDNIHNKGITFETSFSDKGLYMYLVKK